MKSVFKAAAGSLVILAAIDPTQASSATLAKSALRTVTNAVTKTSKGSLFSSMRKGGKNRRSWRSHVASRTLDHFPVLDKRVVEPLSLSSYAMHPVTREQRKSEAALNHMAISEDRLDEFGRIRAIPSQFHWTFQREIMPEGIFPSESGRFAFIEPLGRCLFRGPKWAVFELPNQPNATIKYSRYERGKIGAERYDPILREAHYLKLLEDVPDLANRVLYYSGPIQSPAVDGKLRAEIGKSSTAFPGGLALVRYIITERVGLNLAEYRTWNHGMVNPDVAVKLGIQMIRLLQRLHEAKNAIHGSVSLKSFAVSLKTGNLIMTDFEKARIVDPNFDFVNGEDTSTAGSSTPVINCRAVQSQWEDRSIMPSFRDDVYRVLISVAMFIHGYAFDNYFTDICEYLYYYYAMHQPDAQWYMQEHYRNMKEKSNFFNSEPFLTELDLIPRRPLLIKNALQGTELEAKSEDVLVHFEKALRVLRATRIHEKPNYEAIIAELSEIVKMADGTPEANTDVDLSE